MSQTTSTARLEARISTDLHAMLKRAAEIQGRTLTDFVVAAVQAAAQPAIGGLEGFVVFVVSLPQEYLQPPSLLSKAPKLAAWPHHGQ
jgi:uncharacterized protein (DUF1778 family)